MVMLMDRAKLYVEGAGAVGVAAVQPGSWSPPATGTTCVVLSGGNVDLGVVPGLIRRHETDAGRRLVVFARIDDRPGSLVRLLGVFAAAGANLVEVEHQREGVDLHVRQTGVHATFEVRSPEHAAAGRRRRPGRRLPGPPRRALTLSSNACASSTYWSVGWARWTRPPCSTSSNPPSSGCSNATSTTTKEWFPHEYVPYGRGRDAVAGEEWTRGRRRPRRRRDRRRRPQLADRQPAHRGQPAVLLPHDRADVRRRRAVGRVGRSGGRPRRAATRW